MNMVKQERHDDPEIIEMAAKIAEANKKAPNMPKQNIPTNRPPNSNTILGYLTKTNGKGKNDVASLVISNSNSDKSNSVLDDRSQKGQFGWSTLGKIHIPYIFRGEDKFVAVRMVEMKVLNKYLNFLHQDIYNCTCIRSYYITESESRLFNEINFIHCDSLYGRDQFTGRDLIVRLTDAVEFYNFLDACYSKLLLGHSNPLDRCGFIRINKESVVPYTIYNTEKFVPLFYFEGETDNLKLRANKLEGWDLSYLKFCCKVQGIRNELFAHDSCSVISLNDIRNYFPPGTAFEDYWPQKMVDTQFLITDKSGGQTQVGQWTRQPVGPPLNTHPAPSPKPATQAKAAPNMGQMNIVQSMYNNYMGAPQPQYQPRTASQAVRSNYGTVNSNPMQFNPGSFSYPSIATTQTPPPLVRTNSGSNNHQLINQQPAHQQPARSQASTTQDDRSNGGLDNPLRKILQIPDAPATPGHIPYKIQKAIIEGKMVPAINIRPYSTELLVTLNDLATVFFNNVPVQSCQHVLHVLGIHMFKGNSQQMHVLVENGKCQSMNDFCPLVQVRSIIDFMPQLKYMLGAMEVGPKRS